MKKLISIVLLLNCVSAFAGPDPKGILELEGYGNSLPTGITAKRTRGDFTIKESLITDSHLFYIRAFGYNGTSISTLPTGEMGIQAAESWTTTANGTDIRFKTTPNGSTTSTEVLKISTAGYTIPNNLEIRSLQANSPSSVMITNYSTGVYTPTSTLQLISSTGAITLTGIPTIATSPFVNGTEIVLLSTSSNITLNNQSITPGNCLQLDGNTVITSTFTPVRLRLYNGIWFKEN